MNTSNPRTFENQIESVTIKEKLIEIAVFPKIIYHKDLSPSKI